VLPKFIGVEVLANLLVERLLVRQRLLLRRKRRREEVSRTKAA
jgi:hypothetical protein